MQRRSGGVTIEAMAQPSRWGWLFGASPSKPPRSAEAQGVREAHFKD
jgi:hypothetical protein